MSLCALPLGLDVSELLSIMGNTDSVMVQKRMARFRPEERSMIDGVFERLQGGSGSSGEAGAVKTLQLETLQVSERNLHCLSAG